MRYGNYCVSLAKAPPRENQTGYGLRELPYKCTTEAYMRVAQTHLGDLTNFEVAHQRMCHAGLKEVRRAHPDVTFSKKAAKCTACILSLIHI